MASRSSSKKPPAADRPAAAAVVPGSAPALVPQGQHRGKPGMTLTRPFTLAGARNRAGTLHLVSNTVSKCHAAIVNDNGRIYVRDLASRTHVYVNGRVIREVELADGDLLQIESFTFKLAWKGERTDVPTPPVAQLEMAGSAEALQLDGRTTTIGRRSTCDLTLEDESVSTVHAIIFELDGLRFIRDLGSRTGTFVNGTAIHQQPLNLGDRIRIGSAEYRYQPSHHHADSFDDMAELEDLVGTARLGHAEQMGFASSDDSHTVSEPGVMPDDAVTTTDFAPPEAELPAAAGLDVAIAAAASTVASAPVSLPLDLVGEDHLDLGPAPVRRPSVPPALPVAAPVAEADANSDDDFDAIPLAGETPVAPPALVPQPIVVPEPIDLDAEQEVDGLADTVGLPPAPPPPPKPTLAPFIVDETPSVIAPVVAIATAALPEPASMNLPEPEPEPQPVADAPPELSDEDFLLDLPELDASELESPEAMQPVDASPPASAEPMFESLDALPLDFDLGEIGDTSAEPTGEPATDFDLGFGDDLLETPTSDDTAPAAAMPDAVPELDESIFEELEAGAPPMPPMSPMPPIATVEAPEVPVPAEPQSEIAEPESVEFTPAAEASHEHEVIAEAPPVLDELTPAMGESTVAAESFADDFDATTVLPPEVPQLDDLGGSPNVVGLLPAERTEIVSDAMPPESEPSNEIAEPEAVSDGSGLDFLDEGPSAEIDETPSADLPPIDDAPMTPAPAVTAAVPVSGSAPAAATVIAAGAIAAGAAVAATTVAAETAGAASGKRSIWSRFFGRGKNESQVSAVPPVSTTASALASPPSPVAAESAPVLEDFPSDSSDAAPAGSSPGQFDDFDALLDSPDVLGGADANAQLAPATDQAEPASEELEELPTADLVEDEHGLEGLPPVEFSEPHAVESETVQDESAAPGSLPLIGTVETTISGLGGMGSQTVLGSTVNFEPMWNFTPATIQPDADQLAEPVDASATDAGVVPQELPPDYFDDLVEPGGAEAFTNDEAETAAVPQMPDGLTSAESTLPTEPSTEPSIDASADSFGDLGGSDFADLVESPAEVSPVTPVEQIAPVPELAETPIEPAPLPPPAYDPFFGMGRDLGSFIGGMPMSFGSMPPIPPAPPEALPPSMPPVAPPPFGSLPTPVGGSSFGAPPARPAKPRLPFGDAPVTFDTKVETLAEVVAVDSEPMPMFGAPPPSGAPTAAPMQPFRSDLMPHEADDEPFDFAGLGALGQMGAMGAVDAGALTPELAPSPEDNAPAEAFQPEEPMAQDSPAELPPEAPAAFDPQPHAELATDAANVAEIDESTAFASEPEHDAPSTSSVQSSGLAEPFFPTVHSSFSTSWDAPVEAESTISESGELAGEIIDDGSVQAQPADAPAVESSVEDLTPPAEPALDDLFDDDALALGANAGHTDVAAADETSGLDEAFSELAAESTAPASFVNDPAGGPAAESEADLAAGFADLPVDDAIDLEALFSEPYDPPQAAERTVESVEGGIDATPSPEPEAMAMEPAPAAVDHATPVVFESGETPAEFASEPLADAIVEPIAEPVTELVAEPITAGEPGLELSLESAIEMPVEWQPAPAAVEPAVVPLDELPPADAPVAEPQITADLFEPAQAAEVSDGGFQPAAEAPVEQPVGEALLETPVGIEASPESGAAELLAMELPSFQEQVSDEAPVLDSPTAEQPVERSDEASLGEPAMFDPPSEVVSAPVEFQSEPEFPQQANVDALVESLVEAPSVMPAEMTESNAESVGWSPSLEVESAVEPQIETEFPETGDADSLNVLSAVNAGPVFTVMPTAPLDAVTTLSGLAAGSFGVAETGSEAWSPAAEPVAEPAADAVSNFFEPVEPAVAAPLAPEMSASAESIFEPAASGLPDDESGSESVELGHIFDSLDTTPVETTPVEPAVADESLPVDVEVPPVPDSLLESPASVEELDSSWLPESVNQPTADMESAAGSDLVEPELEAIEFAEVIDEEVAEVAEVTGSSETAAAAFDAEATDGIVTFDPSSLPPAPTSSLDPEVSPFIEHLPHTEPEWPVSSTAPTAGSVRGPATAFDELLSSDFPDVPEEIPSAGSALGFAGPVAAIAPSERKAAQPAAPLARKLEKPAGVRKTLTLKPGPGLSRAPQPKPAAAKRPSADEKPPVDPATGKLPGTRGPMRMILLFLVLMFTAASVAGIYLLFAPPTNVRGALKFRNLPDPSTAAAARSDFQARQKKSLTAESVVRAARKNLEPGVTPGFLGEDATSVKLLDTALTAAKWDDRDSALVVTIDSAATGDDGADRKRMVALLKAMYAAYVPAQSQSATPVQLEAQQGEITRLSGDIARVSAMRQLLSDKAAKAVELRAAATQLKQRVDDVKRQTIEAGVLVRSLDRELERMEGQMSRPTTGPAGAAVASSTQPGIAAEDVDPELKQLTQQLRTLNDSLAAATDARDLQVGQAKLSLEAAQKQFDTQVSLARETAAGDAAMTQYLETLQALQKQLKRYGDQAAQEQQDERDRLTKLKSDLAQATTARIQRAWDSDPQLTTLMNRRAVLERRYNAAAAASLPEAESVRIQLADLDKQVEALRGLIANKDEYDPLTQQFLQFINDSVKASEKSQQRREAGWATFSAEFAKAKPDSDKLPAEQKARALKIDESYQMLADARQGYEKSVAEASAKTDKSVRELSAQVASQQARVDARKHQLAGVRLPAGTTQPAENALPSAIDDATRLAALSEKRTARDQAQATEAKLQSDSVDALIAYRKAEGDAEEAANASQAIKDYDSQLSGMRVALLKAKQAADGAKADPLAAVLAVEPDDRSVDLIEEKDRRPVFSLIATFTGMLLMLMSLAATRAPLEASRPGAMVQSQTPTDDFSEDSEIDAEPVARESASKSPRKPVRVDREAGSAIVA